MQIMTFCGMRSQSTILHQNFFQWLAITPSSSESAV